jgi:molybdate transport system ATP-binding protein
MIAAGLSLRLRHAFPGLAIDIGIDAPSPGVTMLFGASGAGKSTVIAAAAGLLRPRACRFAIEGDVLADTDRGIWLPAERRRAGVVFQESRLFPHLTVAGNLRFGLRRAGAERRIAFDDVIALLGIAPLLARRPRTLSGGERQRVAIGRALLAQPRVLLMDEPLASLDAPRKAEIIPYLARLKTALRLPILYVTHDIDEVSRLADYLVLIERGRVVAAGTIDAMTARADVPLALRDDAGATLRGRVVAHDAARALTTIACGEAHLLVPPVDAAVGAAIRVRVLAREVILALRAPEAVSVRNVVAGTVQAIVYDPARYAAMVAVDLGGAAILARLTRDAVARLALAPGVPVFALVKSMAVALAED